MVLLALAQTLVYAIVETPRFLIGCRPPHIIKEPPVLAIQGRDDNIQPLVQRFQAGRLLMLLDCLRLEIFKRVPTHFWLFLCENSSIIVVSFDIDLSISLIDFVAAS
jgi:hypothetical protein